MEMFATLLFCSGSDLRNLCMAAAMWPVRELASTLQERKDSQGGVSTSAGGARGEASILPSSQWQLESLEWSPKLRAIMQEDFDAALRQVRIACLGRMVKKYCH
jgi:SpoVK/Ycf46/Vps4 family AAA+-type ATPase